MQTLSSENEWLVVKQHLKSARNGKQVMSLLQNKGISLCRINQWRFLLSLATHRIKEKDLAAVKAGIDDRDILLETVDGIEEDNVQAVVEAEERLSTVDVPEDEKKGPDDEADDADEDDSDEEEDEELERYGDFEVCNWLGQYDTLKSFWNDKFSKNTAQDYTAWLETVDQEGIASLLVQMHPNYNTWSLTQINREVHIKTSQWDRRKKRRNNDPDLNRKRILRDIGKGTRKIRMRTLIKYNIKLSDIPESSPNYTYYEDMTWPDDTGNCPLKIGAMVTREHGIQGIIQDIPDEFCIVQWHYPERQEEHQYESVRHPRQEIERMIRYYPHEKYSYARFCHEIDEVPTNEESSPRSARIAMVANPQLKEWAPSTKAKYKGNLRAIMRIAHDAGLMPAVNDDGTVINSDLVDLGNLLRDQVDDLIAELILERPASYQDLAKTILTLCTVIPCFKKWLTPLVYNKWKACGDRGAQAAIERSEQRAATCRTIRWRAFIRLVRSSHDFTIAPIFERPKYASSDYILLALYADYTLRDDFGSLRVRYADPSDEDEFATKNYICVESIENVYICLNRHKTQKVFPFQRFSIRDPYLRAAIWYSVSKNPREFLIGDGTKLSLKVKAITHKYLGSALNIRQLRKAKVTESRLDNANNPIEHQRLAREMLHSKDIADLHYTYITTPYELAPYEDANDGEYHAARQKYTGTRLTYRDKQYKVCRVFKAPHINNSLYFEGEGDDQIRSTAPPTTMDEIEGIITRRTMWSA